MNASEDYSESQIINDFSYDNEISSDDEYYGNGFYLPYESNDDSEVSIYND